MGRRVVSLRVMVNAQERKALSDYVFFFFNIICIEELILERDAAMVATDLKIPFPLLKVDYGCIFKFLWDSPFLHIH